MSVWRRLGMASAVGLWTLAFVSSVGAQVPREEPRLALLIGNSAYRESPLRNPVNDVRAMAQRFKELGFTVFAYENVSKRTMEAAIIEFGRRLSEGGVGAFYYAGHGLQVRGRNYLVPVDADIEDEASTRVAAVDVELLLEQMAKAKNRVNLVVLDACRNNPFERRMRGASRGLAAVDAARGTLVAYATAPGSVAADGDGKNGLYTEELLEALREPGLKVEEVFKRVRINVARRSKGAQTPWESSSLTGDLVVNVTVNVTTAAVSPPTASLSAPAPDREGLFYVDQGQHRSRGLRGLSQAVSSGDVRRARSPAPGQRDSAGPGAGARALRRRLDRYRPVPGAWGRRWLYEAAGRAGEGGGADGAARPGRAAELADARREDPAGRQGQHRRPRNGGRSEKRRQPLESRGGVRLPRRRRLRGRARAGNRADDARPCSLTFVR